MSDITPAPKPPLRVGGAVLSIVPQTFDETLRIARAVCIGGLAPAALIGNLTGDNAASAVAIAIMSGAELGLQPMVALRSFTVINGKPALYGDGLINVVRQSGKVAYLRTGCDDRDGQLVGWCEAKRNDTNEEKRVEFSQADAIRAGLWSDTAKIKKFKSNGESYEKANDSPWFRYPQRMLAWRAAGWCLRELFGDVLGGIRDEFEAREIAEADDMRDVTTTAQVTRSSPPPVPDEPEPLDVAAFVQEIIDMVGAAVDEDALIARWEEMKIDDQLADHQGELDEVYDARNARLAQFQPEAEEGGEQQGGEDQAETFPLDRT
jgi:hypothetical protein